jgi:hypothetical protein
MVAVAFQSFVYSEMHSNNYFFYFLKIIFDINVLKRSKNNINFKEKNHFFRNMG